MRVSIFRSVNRTYDILHNAKEEFRSSRWSVKDKSAIDIYMINKSSVTSATVHFNPSLTIKKYGNSTCNSIRWRRQQTVAGIQEINAKAVHSHVWRQIPFSVNC